MRSRTLLVPVVLASVIPTLAAPPAAGAPSTTLVVNEIDYDQPGTDAAEFVEILNVSGDGVALDGHSLVLVNGASGGAAIYDTIPLPAVSLAAGDTFVVCANGATVAGCDLDDSPDTNFVQNGDPDAVAIVAGAAVVDTVSYMGATPGYTEGTSGAPDDAPDDAMSIARRGTGSDVDTDDNATDFTFVAATPGAANDCGGDPDPDPDPGICGGEATPISVVQGPGDSSPLAGQVVTLEGVVVGDFQGPAPALGGVFVQAAVPDGDPATSEGVFVFDPDGPDVAAGDTVRAAGTVTEFFGLTEIADAATLGCGPAPEPVTPTALDLPVGAVGDLEPRESMLVTFPEVLTVTETFNLGRFGEIVVSADGRLFIPTNGQAGTEDNDESALVVDDGRTGENLVPVPYLQGDPPTLRLGDTVSDLTGVLSFGFEEYRLQPTEVPAFTGTNARTAAPNDVGGDLTVASLNVLNYFTTLNPSGDPDGPRGANSAEELARQQAKIVAAIIALDADVVALMEIENIPDPTAIDTLVDAVNAEVGAGTYTGVFDEGTTVGDDAIKVDIMYRPAAVTPVGEPRIFDDAGGDFANARLPLAQTFDAATGGRFSVVVNHFKSKSCTGATGENLDTGQGCYNADRVGQAEALLGLVAELALTDPDVLVVGDLNSYGEEDPIDTLEAGGLADLVDAGLAEDDQYSYVFFGQAGYLDHALATASLTPAVTGVDIWHINSDEPVVLDYNTEFNPPELYQPDQFRASDHDPVLVGLDLEDEGGADVVTCGSLSATVPELEALGYQVFVGTDGDDRLVGSTGDDVLVGLGGDDLVIARSGDDVMCGGDADDLLLGGSGADELDGGGGDDLGDGGGGPDECTGVELARRC